MQSTEPVDLSKILLEKLQIEKILKIEAHQWSEHLRTELHKSLSHHNIHDLTVYRIKDTGAYWLCIQGKRPEQDDLEQVYYPRSFILKMMPLFAFLWVIFTLTALVARDLSALMSGVFLIFLPFCIGAITQYFFSYRGMNSLGQMHGQQMMMTVIIIAISTFILREGVICLIMASPLVYMSVLFGASVMRAITKSFWRPTPKIYSLSVVPLIVIVLNPFSANTLYSTTKNEIIIDAPASEVFQAINNIQNINESEIKNSPIFWMGFPKPLSGMTVSDEDGFTRQIHWQRGIYFEEKITHSEPNQLLAWNYRFTPESFPKGSLDDHVEIGGQYLDLASTDYRLEAMSPTQTKLILTIDYRLSTEVNWYAKLWTDYVLNEFSDVVLNIYKKRLENKT